MKNKKVNLTVEYRTEWGEEVVVSGNHITLGNYQTYLPLSTSDGYTWSVQVEFEAEIHDISYQYAIRNNGIIIKEEACRDIHHIALTKETILAKDTWTNSPQGFILNKNIFKEIWLHSDFLTDQPILQYNVLLEGCVANINTDEELAICGNTKELGEWDTKRALMVDQTDFPKTKVLLQVKTFDSPIEYKYLILDKITHKVKRWENNDNRVIRELPIDKFDHIKIDEGEIDIDIDPWKGAGLTVPIFSLRTKNSFGIGEFLDLMPLADWCKKTNLKIIQILPINDTISTHDWPDSYPYKCTSVFALNPVYLNFEEMGIGQTKYNKEYQNLKKTLNKKKYINYPTIQEQKLKYIHELYSVFGRETLNSREYIQFFDRNKHWLLSYAAYLCLINKYNSNDIKLWGEYSTYSTEKVTELMKDYKETFNIVFYTQYHLYKQLRKASNYIKKCGIALKGDLPIGISKHSVDAWQFPSLFNLSNQAGAPPDAFAEFGQNWGFPTYNWDQMQQEDYAWWKNRLQYMSQFYDAFRIDHILGFFRIWSIPESVIYGTLGQFDPAIPLSQREIESYGLPFDKEKMTRPYVTKQILQNLFIGEEVDIIINTYFIENVNKTLYFKSTYDSQQKLAKQDDLSKEIKDKLIYIHSNVLFVVDLKDQHCYHPRIDAHKTLFYQQELSTADKEAFDSLYEDFFYHRNDKLWKKEAYEKLPALTKASKMLVCGEDLGMIPNTVPEVMKNLAIFSLEVARMPKLLGEEIGNSYKYAYASVSTFSTHDMSTIRGWWSENKAQRQAISNYADLHLTNSESPTEEDIKAILTRELSTNSILCIEAIQDWLALSKKYHIGEALDEQINIPADSNHKWRYRIPCYIEDLLDDTSLNNKINELINKTKRY